MASTNTGRRSGAIVRRLDGNGSVRTRPAIISTMQNARASPGRSAMRLRYHLEGSEVYFKLHLEPEEKQVLRAQPKFLHRRVLDRRPRKYNEDEYDPSWETVFGDFLGQ